jgi:hypothetical protein
MVFVPPGGVNRENGEKLEFDDPLNEIAMFSRPQGSRNELKLVPKRAERRKKSREDANSEQRREQQWQESVRGALWGEIKAPRGDG